MFLGFFEDLRRAGVPVTLREYLAFLGALGKGVAEFDLEGFYYLARCSLVKDEKHYDRFDAVFSRAFGELADRAGVEEKELPDSWLRKISELHLDEDARRRVRALGGFDALLEELRKRLLEQRERHEGGSKWIGTGGTSPFGAYGYNPAGIRIGQDGSRHRRAVKVWDRREWRNYDDRRELGTRNFKMALRKLRRFVRDGSLEELDLEGTIRATARQGGLLDLAFRPERRNRVKVLMLLDVGGSMDVWAELCERLFSAARSELKELRVLHFHNCVYEMLWKDNPRREEVEIDTVEVFRTYGRDWNVVVVGDASMSPYEIIEPGGSVEHWNEETGESWLKRLFVRYPRLVWLNPVPRDDWRYTTSIRMIEKLAGGRMHELTVKGLEDGLAALRKG